MNIKKLQYKNYYIEILPIAPAIWIWGVKKGNAIRIDKERTDFFEDKYRDSNPRKEIPKELVSLIKLIKALYF